jgi:hypothetical protein
VIRDLYLRTAGSGVELIAEPQAERGWRQPSRLPDLSIGGLAGHLARSILQVEWFLDREVPSEPAMTAAEYYANATGITERGSPLNESVRVDGEEGGAEGARVLCDRSTAALARLRGRLASEPPERLIEASRRRVISLDEYLRTRLVELTVHIDDLAASLGVPPPSLPVEAGKEALDVLIESACLRYGVFAVLSALARSEQELPEALRVV